MEHRVPESVVSIFDKLATAEPPASGSVLFDTACVLGCSVAGLLAARVLSDHARRVIVVERDEVSIEGRSRTGTPHDQQVHTLLPAGQHWLERWLPGFTREIQDMGAVLSGPDTTIIAFDGHPQANSGADTHLLLAASRPFLEARIRARVVALPNVSILRARATGLQYRDGAVRVVRYVDDHAEKALEVDFVVDAMGRSSRLSDWVEQEGYDKPRIERLKAPINYACALFKRDVKAADLKVACSLGIFSPEYAIDGVSVVAANPIEGEQWLVGMMGFGDDRPGRTIDEFREICAKLPGAFGEVTRGTVTRDIVTYHQEESRRRDFTELRQFPARLVSVGDAVASFNPTYGQGMSSAALHASCLSSYLNNGPDLTTAATDFFRLQQVVVDAAWAVSAGGDSARLDAANGVAVPEEVRQQRLALQQVMGAALVDGSVARAFNEVSFMLRHPATLADPALMEQVSAANGSMSN
jgi:2-polyprenyl-6-methoxyphenol hydroxylase-like FAD-dependent oxidoreductase